MSENVTGSRIARDLRKLGIRSGDVLAVHSSLKSIGYVDGGAAAVVDALKEVVGAGGTIIMPVFNSPVDVFYAKHQPSKVGAVTETFRTSPGTKRSMHPTHSVAAWGDKAHNMVREHQKHEALGINSPFHRLAKLDGKVLMIGIGFARCSIIHVAESIAGAPYQDIFYPGYHRTTQMIGINGRRMKYTPNENPGDSAAFGVVEERMRSDGKLTEGRIGAASAILAGGMDIIDASLELMAANGTALLCKARKCAVCPARRSRVESLDWRYYPTA
ncbi:MAG: AAC(3) family N-acetyltransferase [Planctomycetes bacterium]|nr:AAC(3) family N-acetyltransferase [Planctomycetota bacterium]